MTYDASRELRSTICDGARLLVASATGDDGPVLEAVARLVRNNDLPGAVNLIHSVVRAGGQALAVEAAYEATEALDDERPPRVSPALRHLVKLEGRRG